MPPIPPNFFTQPPYDPVETVLQFARVIANDAGISLAGNLLADTQPYIMPLLNLAWRKLKDRLSNNDIESFPQEIIIFNLPLCNPQAFLDPATQCYIDYGSYFDGSTFDPTFVLPQDMQIPLRLWERTSGMNAEFIPMHQAQDGLAAITKSSYLRNWEWRQDKIYFMGANQKLDLRIRYKSILREFQTTSDTIPLIQCAVAIAYLVVEIHAAGRGSVVLPAFTAEKELAIKNLVNQTTRKQQRSNFRRIPYSRRPRFF